MSVWPQADGSAHGVRRGVRAKLTASFALLVLVIAVFIQLYVPARLEQQAIAGTSSKATAMATTTAYAASAGLLFEDDLAMADAIAPVARNRDVRYVAIIDAAGRPRAGHPSGGGGRWPDETGITADGLTYAVRVPVTSNGNEIGTVVLGLSLDALRAEVRQARAGIAVVSALVLVLGLAGAAVISTLLTRPLARMVGVMERVSAGDLTQRTAIRSNDEVGYLGRSFDHMVARLEAAYGELQDVNRELETRVLARTAELERQIDERRRAEEAVRESEHQFRTMFEAAAFGVALVDGNGRILEANHALAGMLGTERQALLNGSIESVLRRQDDGEGWTAYRAVVRGERDEISEEVRCTGPGGALLWGRAATSAVRDRQGELRFAIVMIENTTEQKELEERLQQSQKLEAVGRLAGGIAHDFNNLLTTINGLGDLILDEMAEGDPIRQDLEEIRKAGTRAASLTSQLLAFSRRQVVKPVVLDLNASIRDIAKMLRRLIGEDVRLELDLAPSTSPMNADPGQISQIVMNLALNARDAMPDGGNLRIATRTVILDTAAAVRHGAAAAGSHVLLEVSDTGHGMDEHTRQHIFEPFFTTKAVGKGTGLGLATVYGIVKQAGGGIAVETEPGRGARFSIYFPALDASRVTDLRAGPAPAHRGSETILVIEDEPAVRSLVARILRSRGYAPLDASNGAEALRLLHDYTGPLDAVLTDVIMPEMSGPQTVREIVRQRPDVRVIYMSGYTQDEVLHHGIAQDEAMFLQKPMTPSALAAKVREALDSRPVRMAS